MTPEAYARAIVDRLFPAEGVPLPGIDLLEIADITYPHAVTQLGYAEPLTAWAALLYAVAGLEMPGPVPTFPVARRRPAKTPKKAPSATSATETVDVSDDIRAAFELAAETPKPPQVTLDDL